MYDASLNDVPSQVVQSVTNGSGVISLGTYPFTMFSYRDTLITPVFAHYFVVMAALALNTLFTILSNL